MSLSRAVLLRACAGGNTMDGMEDMAVAVLCLGRAALVAIIVYVGWCLWSDDDSGEEE